MLFLCGLLLWNKGEASQGMHAGGEARFNFATLVILIRSLSCLIQLSYHNSIAAASKEPSARGIPHALLACLLFFVWKTPRLLDVAFHSIHPYTNDRCVFDPRCQI
jgi:hypothetical protein